MQSGSSSITGAVMAGGGCLMSIAGLVLCLTFIFIPFGVPLTLLGGWLFGTGLNSLGLMPGQLAGGPAAMRAGASATAGLSPDDRSGEPSGPGPQATHSSNVAGSVPRTEVANTTDTDNSPDVSRPDADHPGSGPTR